MGVVYKARDTRLDRLVALKFLPHRGTSGEVEYARFLQEARAAAALNHPNVCSVIDIQEADGQQFIVMEYIEGKTLREVKHGITVKQAVDIAVQVAEGLAAAHDNGIVHRDIKSDNIMVRNDGRVQIMDFGLAKLQGPSVLTNVGSTIGTTAYLSPEQVQGEEADHRSDIFALGVVLYELLAGQLPFKGGHEAAILYEIVNVDPTPVRATRPEIEPELERIVMKCLEKGRENRYQSAREVAVDLKRFRRDSEGRRLQPAPAPKVPARALQRRQLWLRIGVPVAVLIVGGVVALFLLRNRGEALDSLAVLPFENAGGDQSTEYLSDGITESIINSLAKIPALRVIPRSTVFHFKGREFDPLEVGSKLSVRAVLTGRIVKMGNELNVQVDLIDVTKQSELWGQQYRRDANDLLALQADITDEVSNRLRLGLSGDVKKLVAKRYTENPEAFKLYLQGRFYWNKRRAPEIQKAIDCFNQALALDPTYALAYVGLADCYLIQEQYAGLPGSETYPKAEAAAARALEIDTSLAEAHTTLGFAAYSMWNWSKAEDEFKTSLVLNPKYPTTYHWYSLLLHTLGRHEEAFKVIRRAQELDPLSPIITLNIALGYQVERNYQKEIEVENAILMSDSTFAIAYYFMVIPFIHLGKLNEAYAAALKGVQFSGRSVEPLSYLGYCLALLGKREEALTIVKELEQRYVSRTSPGYYVARVFSGLGNTDSVFSWLNVDYRNHAGVMGFLSYDQILEPYHSDPRFVDLMRKIGLKE